ncbi:MAG: hypothetical protein SFV54_24360 [Bryobacteraceae bacterium]|nr:hypothetical protein [Bryobacteraceae bacterium]
MSGYLDTYGAADARRERIIKWLVISALVVAIGGGIAWYLFRDYREERQASLFLERLQAKDYPGAYQTWGCSQATPCRHYPYQSFLDDWGPQSKFANPAGLKLDKQRSCMAGIITSLNASGGEKILLWVERKDLTIGFAPWPVCNPRMAAQ